jgi:hypothetical protein
MKEPSNYLLKRNTLSKGKSYTNLCIDIYLLISLAEELLAKETIGLPDIVRILGDRPYPLKESVKEYLIEMQDRQAKEEEQKKEEVAAAH